MAILDAIVGLVEAFLHVYLCVQGLDVSPITRTLVAGGVLVVVPVAGVYRVPLHEATEARPFAPDHCEEHESMLMV